MKIRSKFTALFLCCICLFCVAIFSAMHSVASPNNKMSKKVFATVDWTVAETLIALGETPKGVGDVQGYRNWVKSPVLPASVLDLGVRMQPNPEQIWLLARQVAKNKQSLHFINTPFYASVTPLLEKVATVDQVSFYATGSAWDNMQQATYHIANIIGRPDAAENFMQHYWQTIEQLKPQAKPFTDRPIVLVQFYDTRHLRIYAENSALGAVLKQLGFQNAWQGKYNQWGFEVIQVTELAKLPANSRFVVVKPYPSNIATTLAHNTLWQHLDLAKDPVILPAVWTFGGVPSALRFAETFVAALNNGGEAW